MAICNYRVHGIPSYGCIFYNHLGVQYIYTYAVGFTAQSIQSHESFQMNSSIDRKVCISTFWRRRRKTRRWWILEKNSIIRCVNGIIDAMSIIAPTFVAMILLLLSGVFFYSKLQQTFFLQRLVKMARQNSLGWHLKFALMWWESEGKRERAVDRCF